MHLGAAVLQHTCGTRCPLLTVSRLHRRRPHRPQVGAGGNAGNQSAIKVIRGLATGAMKPTGPGVRRALAQQLAVGLLLGAGLAAGGWVRVYLTNGDALNATAISISLFLIVLTSVVAGTGALAGCARARRAWENVCGSRRASRKLHAVRAEASPAGLPRCCAPDRCPPLQPCSAAVRAGAGGRRPRECRHIHPGAGGPGAGGLGAAAPLVGTGARLPCTTTRAPVSCSPSPVLQLPSSPRHPPSPLLVNDTPQVVMDISGVLITCATCHLVLDQLAAGLRATG